MIPSFIAAVFSAVDVILARFVPDCKDSCNFAFCSPIRPAYAPLLWGSGPRYHVPRIPGPCAQPRPPCAHPSRCGILGRIQDILSLRPSALPVPWGSFYPVPSSARRARRPNDRYPVARAPERRAHTEAETARHCIPVARPYQWPPPVPERPMDTAPWFPVPERHSHVARSLGR